MFSLICAWINNWACNRDAGDLRCHRAHHDVTVMIDWDYITFKIIVHWSNNIFFIIPPILFIGEACHSLRFLLCCHDMETFSALLALIEEKPPVAGYCLHKCPVMRSVEVFFLFLDCCNRRLNKHSICPWFDRPIRPWAKSYLVTDTKVDYA